MLLIRTATSVAVGEASAIVTVLRENTDAAEVVATYRFIVRAVGDAPPPDRHLPDWQDFALISCLPLAMREADGRVHVEGRVSRSCVENMESASRYWACFRPTECRAVEISADQLGVAAAARSGVAVAISGGVDSAHAILSALEAAPSTDDVIGFTVIGFDVNADDQDLVREHLGVIEAVARSTGIHFYRVDTDWQQHVSQKWARDFFFGLSSVCHLFSGMRARALVGSDQSVHLFDKHWGSNPITNSLFSTDVFRIGIDGELLTRSEKVARVGALPKLATMLKVCTYPHLRGSQAYNCGRCEKCTRTKMNFLVNGLTVPESLGDPIRLADVRKIWIGDRIKFAYYADIVSRARDRGFIFWWIPLLYVALFLGLLRIGLVEIRQTRRRRGFTGQAL